MQFGRTGTMIAAEKGKIGILRGFLARGGNANDADQVRSVLRATRRHPSVCSHH